MQTKLTLSVDKDLVEQAKKLAYKKGTSLSKLFQKLLVREIQDESSSDSGEPLPELSDKLKRLYGSMELPKGLDEKEAREDYLLKKHG
ncbi:DUF6364 family protein [Owenweeksia hongkongensis]|uniref:DUF6364 family protein n=1 Tax=Owenweeksia hongkongensis TaxID=253245 RepID=UPI003A94FABF